MNLKELIIQEFRKVDPEDTGWIYDYHLGELIVRVMSKYPRTSDLNGRLVEYRGPIYEKTSDPVKNFLQDTRRDAWYRGRSLLIDDDSYHDITPLTKKKIATLIARLDIVHRYVLDDERIIHIDDAVTSLPPVICEIHENFHLDSKPRGRAPPAHIAKLVADGTVKLGCTKCRYQKHGCKQCRKRAGILE